MSMSKSRLPVGSATTIASYEDYADTYARLVSNTPSSNDAAALRRLAESGPEILEIGSGPGRDADYLETLGARVLRTDATRAFLKQQAARGKRGQLLNVITDKLGGPYDGVLAFCVLIHVGKDQVDQVLAKIFASLRPGGAFLVSLRDGDGETLGAYHTVYWRRDEFVARLEATGFVLEWDEFSTDCDGDDWLTFLARRPS
jgi:2-polyprenyl-3-methyl-5-hydroxy-6-metoxy-1,4-benzoquinol methylase